MNILANLDLILEIVAMLDLAWKRMINICQKEKKSINQIMFHAIIECGKIMIIPMNIVIIMGKILVINNTGKEQWKMERNK